MYNIVLRDYSHDSFYIIDIQLVNTGVGEMLYFNKVAKALEKIR